MISSIVGSLIEDLNAEIDRLKFKVAVCDLLIAMSKNDVKEADRKLAAIAELLKIKPSADTPPRV